MGWDIPSTKQQQNVTISRPKDWLLTGINQLRRNGGNRVSGRHTYVDKDQENQAGLKYFW